MKKISDFINHHFTVTVGSAAFLIGLWGVLTIYSAQSGGGAPLLLAAKQLCFLLFSGLAMLLLAAVPFAVYRKYCLHLAAAAYLLLIMVLFCGAEVRGMRGWFAAGPLYIQPAEIAKGVFLVLLVLVNLHFRSAGKRFFAGAAVTLLWTAPILLQPDLGTAFAYWGIWAAVYFICGGSWRYLLLVPLLAGTAAVFFIMRHAYAWKRITAFLNPDADLAGSGWHIRQFQLAIARGGLYGEKLGNALWSNNYLPFSYNDSAYAAMTETLGLFGAAVLLLLFGALLGSLLMRAMAITEKSDAERCVICGTAAAIAIQLMLHCGVNTALLPPTGTTLPLISYGGSSLLGTFMILGIAVSASRAAAASSDDMR